MAGPHLRSRWLPALVLASIAGMTACGSSSSGGDATETGGPTTSETTYRIQPWTAVRPASAPDQVVVGFDGPDPLPARAASSPTSPPSPSTSAAWS